MPLSLSQSQVLQNEKRFTCLITGRRWGKTFLAIRQLAKHAAQKPNAICWAVAPSYRMAKQNLWLPLKKKLKDLNWVRSSNESELLLKLKNGSIICLKGADNFDGLRGVGLDFLAIDEFQDVPKEAWSEVLRPTLSDKQGKAMFFGTPRGVGSWSHELFSYALHADDWAAFQYTTLDGGNVPPEEIEAARRDLDSRTFEQEYLATFSTYSGTVAYNFSRKDNVLPYRNTPTVVHIGIDFNYEPMTAAIFVIENEKFWFFDEILLKGSNTDELVAEIKARYPHNKIVCYPDPASRQKKTSAGGKTDFSILMNAGFVVKARNFHTPVRDRINSLNAKLKSADGVCHMFVDPKCKHMIDCLERLCYKRDSTQIDKDSGLDHMVDACSYAIDFISPVRPQIELYEEPSHWKFGTKRWK